MGELGCGIDALSRIRLTDKKVVEFMNEFFPVTLNENLFLRTVEGNPMTGKAYKMALAAA